MTIDYYYVQEAMDSIEIEDIGNVSIQVNNDSGESWLLQIVTDLGWVTVKQFGPVSVDELSLGYSFLYNYFKMEYKESKIVKVIQNFVNSSTKNITQALVISDDDFQSILNKIKEVM